MKKIEEEEGIAAATEPACGEAPLPDDAGEASQDLAAVPTVHVVPPPGMGTADEANPAADAATSNDLRDQGGTPGIGVETTPRLYVW